MPALPERPPMSRHSKTRGAVSPDRIQAVLNAMENVEARLPPGAARIELDIEWSDGCRIKLEAKA